MSRPMNGWYSLSKKHALQTDLFHPPSASKISPTFLLTASSLLSWYRGATSDSPTGMPFSPLNPGTLTTGVCRA